MRLIYFCCFNNTFWNFFPSIVPVRNAVKFSKSEHLFHKNADLKNPRCLPKLLLPEHRGVNGSSQSVPMDA